MPDATFFSTEAGPCYEINEDHSFVDDGVGILAVFDGEFENGLVSDCLKVEFEKETKELLPNTSMTVSIFRSMIESIVERISESMSMKEKGEKGYSAGSTMSAACILNGKIAISHIGDSRIYVLKDEQWELVTTDDTLACDKERAGFSYEDDEQKNMDRNIVTRVIGFPSPHIHHQCLDSRKIKKVFLCTDGFWKSIDPNGIGHRFPTVGDNFEIGGNLLGLLEQDYDHENATLIIASSRNG